MGNFSAYLGSRAKWAGKGNGGVCGWVSLVTGFIVAGLIWYFPKWTHDHVSDRMNAFLIGLVPLLAGAGVFLVRWIYSSYAVFKIERDKRIALEGRLAPCLSVSTDTARSIAHAWWDRGTRMMTFFRVIVSSLSSSNIEDATGYLVSIEKDSKMMWDSEDVPLTFARGEDPDTLCKRIEAGGKYPLDVVVVRNDDNRLFLGTLNRTWPCFKSLEEIFSEKGDYIINLRIAAKDCSPVHAKVKFKWTGNVNTCEIALAQ
jgi:hypothetical protein